MTLQEQSRTLLTVREFAARLLQAEVTVRRHIAAGLVAAVRLGRGRGAVRVDIAELDRYVYGEPEEAA